MQETDPELIAEIAQHGEDVDPELDEMLDEGEVEVDVGPIDPEDLKQDQDVHDDGVDDRIDVAFSKADSGEVPA
jgi:hypothetical protein